jgi:hypothetical protein
MGGSASGLYVPEYNLKKSDLVANSEKNEYYFKLLKGVVPATKTLIASMVSRGTSKSSLSGSAFGNEAMS